VAATGYGHDSRGRFRSRQAGYTYLHSHGLSALMPNDDTEFFGSLLSITNRSGCGSLAVTTQVQGARTRQQHSRLTALTRTSATRLSFPMGERDAGSFGVLSITPGFMGCDLEHYDDGAIRAFLPQMCLAALGIIRHLQLSEYDDTNRSGRERDASGDAFLLLVAPLFECRVLCGGSSVYREILRSPDSPFAPRAVVVLLSGERSQGKSHAAIPPRFLQILCGFGVGCFGYYVGRENQKAFRGLVGATCQRNDAFSRQMMRCVGRVQMMGETLGPCPTDLPFSGPHEVAVLLCGIGVRRAIDS